MDTKDQEVETSNVVPIHSIMDMDSLKSALKGLAAMFTGPQATVVGLLLDAIGTHAEHLDALDEMNGEVMSKLQTVGAVLENATGTLREQHQEIEELRRENARLRCDNERLKETARG